MSPRKHQGGGQRRFQPRLRADRSNLKRRASHSTRSCASPSAIARPPVTRGPRTPFRCLSILVVEKRRETDRNGPSTKFHCVRRDSCGTALLLGHGLRDTYGKIARGDRPPAKRPGGDAQG